MNDRPPSETRLDQHSGHADHADHADHAGHRGHGLLMIACCIPMLAIALALVIAGVVSPGLLLVAVGCTALMALMMRGMDHGGGGRD